MLKSEVSESIEKALTNYEVYGIFIIQDIQEIFDRLGIDRQIKQDSIRDNPIQCLTAIYLKIIQKDLSGDWHEL